MEGISGRCKEAVQELEKQGDEASGGRSGGWKNMQEIFGRGGVVTHTGTCQCKEQAREGWSMVFNFAAMF